MKPDGNTVWVRSTTSLVRDSEGAPKYYVSVIEDITTGQAARAATARLAALVQASNDAILSVTRDGMIDTWNPGAERLFGYTAADVVGQHARILGGFAKSSQAREMLDRCLAGEPARVEVDFRHKDHTVIDVAMSVSPIGSNGAVTGLSVMIEDIRERRKWQRQQHLLNRELQHRVKNSLAVVQSIANQTQRSSPTLERFRTAFQGRLQALAAANDLLLQTVWTGSDLATLIDQQLAPLLSMPTRQLGKRGDSLALPAELTVPLSLAFHELGTNAMKYGALSVAGGRIDISWTVEPVEGGGRRLVLTWTESGGPEAKPANRRGFGSTLILQGIPGAAVEHRLEPTGLVCVITLVLAEQLKEDFNLSFAAV